MPKTNLILTDIMKTGHHYHYGNYIRQADIAGEQIQIEDDYYKLPKDLSQFTRRIALICSIHPVYMDNREYVEDMDRKIKQLSAKGFRFIIASPWESRANTRFNNIINSYGAHAYTSWYGEHDWFWFFMLERHERYKNNFVIDHATKKYDFLYLNKMPRSHRRALFDKLQQTDILDNSLYSFIGIEQPIRLPKEYESLSVKDGIYQFENVNHQDQDLFEKPYNDSKISLITESNVNNNEVFITEKIWKAIIMKHVFVVYGNCHTLNVLRQQGFKTFGELFDEDYDNESDPVIRMERLIELCKKLKHMDHRTIYEKTKSLRDHNFELFFNRDKIRDVVSERVRRWLKSFDAIQ